MKSLSYVLWLALFLVLPTLFLWWRFYSTLRQYTGVVAIITMLTLSGLAWDFWGIRYHIWSFPLGHHIGPVIAGLPLEEYLAFVLFGTFVSSLTIVLRFHGHWRTGGSR